MTRNQDSAGSERSPNIYQAPKLVPELSSQPGGIGEGGGWAWL